MAFTDCADAAMGIGGVILNDFVPYGYLAYCLNLTWSALAISAIWLAKVCLFPCISLVLNWWHCRISNLWVAQIELVSSVCSLIFSSQWKRHHVLAMTWLLIHIDSSNIYSAASLPNGNLRHSWRNHTIILWIKLQAKPTIKVFRTLQCLLRTPATLLAVDLLIGRLRVPKNSSKVIFGVNSLRTTFRRLRPTLHPRNLLWVDNRMWVSFRGLCQGNSKIFSRLMTMIFGTSRYCLLIDLSIC